MKKIAAWLLRRLGWRALPLPSEQPARSIICVAPHTSNIDFLIGKLFYMSVGKPYGFLMKRDWFFFPLGYLLRAMGGVPVDRSHKGDMVAQLARDITAQDEMHIAITPEGTRSLREEWRTGFYRIAMAAAIPIELAVIDYQKREVGIIQVFHPTGDIEQDLSYIRSQYHSYQAKHPHLFHDLNA